MLERYRPWLFQLRQHDGGPLSWATQENKLTSVRMLLAWATRTKRLTVKPAAELELPRLPKRPPRAVLSISEMERVLAQPDLSAALGLRDRAILEVLYSTGIRHMELVSLDCTDLASERGALLVREGKGKKDRLVPIGERALQWTHQYLDRVPAQLLMRAVTSPERHALFLSARGRRIRATKLTDRLHQYVVGAGIAKPGSVHIFRHTMAMPMHDAGADIRDLHEMLGHPQLSTTEIYSSRSAKPSAVIAANVALQSSLTPTSIQATVTFYDIKNQTPYPTTAPLSYTWQSGWSNGTYRRIAVPINALSFGPASTGLPTGAYHYTLEIKATVNGVATTGSDTGSFVIVNRVNSSFGAGWWLDGLEQLVTVDANTQLWIGGDGSARLYRRVATSDRFAATEQIERPDTLQEGCPTCGFAFQRLLPNKVLVKFDNAGNHTQTVNALGHVTAFGWGGTLQSITLPVPVNGMTRRYDFEYATATTGDLVLRLSAVRAPVIPGIDRSTYIDASGGVIGSIRFLASNDPNTDVVSFGYLAATGGAASARLMNTRTNRRGHVTSFTYDAADALASAQINMYGAGADLRNGFAAAETRGLSTAVRQDSTWTIWDGPRTDVGDTTRFYVNRFGAPDTLVGARSGITKVTRDLVWPALPATVTRPGGFQTTATYNSRGLVLTSTQVDPLNDGVNATTSYAWDAVFDKPTTITPPLGPVTSMSYRSTDGRPATKTSGGVTVTFDYTPPQFTQPCAGPTFVNYPDGSQDRVSYDGSLCNLSSSATAPRPGTLYSRDEIGRVVKVFTPIDQYGINWRSDTTAYDPSDLVLRTWAYAGPDTLITRNVYDAEGNLDTVATLAIPQIARKRQQSGPGGQVVGEIVRSYSYDPAGRRTGEGSSSRNSSGIFSSGFGWPMAYDPAGNVTLGKDYGAVSRVYDAENHIVTRNGTDNSSYSYDLDGRLTDANNQNAQVHRDYYRNGALWKETLKIQTAGVGTPDFALNIYLTQYTYDLNGRRKQVTNHLNRNSTYTYDDLATGNLKTVTDVAGNLHRFVYDNMARLDSLIRLSGRSDSVVQKNQYDLAGRIVNRTIKAPTTTLYNDAFVYDGRDKVISHNGDALSYSGLGQLTTSTTSMYSPGEEFESDGLGMHRRKQTALYQSLGRTSLTTATDDSVFYTPGTTSIGSSIAHGDPGTTPDTTFYEYIGPGDLSATLTTNHADPLPGTPDVVNGIKTVWGFRRNTLQDYDNENRLRLNTIRKDTLYQGSGGISSTYVATENYYYDALDRRIWVHSYKPLAGCQSIDRSSGCHSFDNHTIWDGDQILSEVRSPLDYDLTADKNLGSGTHYGTVEYTQVGIIDQPIAVRRGTSTVLPHADWRGSIDKGTCTTGGNCGSTTFPGGSSSIYRSPKRLANGELEWYGALSDGQTDASGFQYKRNRYYDPASGSFTQDDPIGIAGGLNTYGYAEGDPANYSDPFGLCPVPGLCFAFALNHWVHHAAEAGTIIRDALAPTVQNLAIVGLTRGAVGWQETAERGLTASGEAHAAQEAAAAAGKSWTTQRRTFWKSEAGSKGAAERWGEKNVERMGTGRAPQIDGKSVELHHTPVPQRAGGTQVVPVTPEQHAQVDPFRFLAN